MNRAPTDRAGSSRARQWWLGRDSSRPYGSGGVFHVRGDVGAGRCVGLTRGRSLGAKAAARRVTILGASPGSLGAGGLRGRCVADSLQRRKDDHLRLATGADVESRRGPGWDDVDLLHMSLPELDLDEIDCSQSLFGRRLRLPLVIAGMTGGTPTAETVNGILATAAESFGVAIGVGSQRAALRAAELSTTYRIARRNAPTALLIANVGAPQLIAQEGSRALTREQIAAAVSMIEADALAVHLNFLQELVQPEGDRRSRGCAAALTALCAAVDVPVIAKETGGGMTRWTAATLRDCGVAALDVGGRGGTSFAAVEGLRAASAGDSLHRALGEVFRDWGVPTAVSVREAALAGLPVIATGGVRSGLDAAKAIALGATAVGVARPLARCALDGLDSVLAWLHRFETELRSAMFLTGSRTVAELRQQRTVLMGQTLAWAQQLDDELHAEHAPGVATRRRRG
jgi:isopentenyl-diphosphate delta-isomerase